MIESKNKISISQMQILMIFNILGSSLLTFPKLISINSANSFLFAIIFGTIISVFFTTIIIYCLNLSNQESLNDFLEDTFGAFIAKFILVLFVLKILFSLTITLNSFVTMTQNILLPKTNTNITLLLFLALSAYLCYKEQSVRAKTAQIIFYIFLFYILFFVITSFFKLNISNIPNLFDINAIDISKGSIYTMLSFSSIIFFYFDYFYLEKKEKVMKASINVITLVGIIFIIFTIVSISIFSLNGIKFLTYPTFDAMSRMSIGNTFITRNEAIVFNFWIFIIFSFVSAGVFYAHLLLSNIFNIKKINNKLYLLFFCLALFAFNIINFDENKLKLYDAYLSIFLIVFLPIIIILKYKINTQLKTVALFLLVPFILGSCSDKIELENRRFVYEIFIDKNIDEFILTYDYVQINNSKEQSLMSNTVKNETLLGCINDAYMSNENLLDFRQVKTIALSKELINDKDMLIGTFNLLAKNNQVGNNTLIVTYDKATTDYTASGIKKEDSISYYLTNFLENNKNNYITSINFDLDSSLIKLRNNETLILPNLTKKESFSLNGSSIISDFNYIGFMDLDATKGYALLEENANEVPIAFNYNNNQYFTKISNSKSKVSFYEQDNKLYVIYKIKVDINYIDKEFYSNYQSIETFTSIINSNIETMCYETFNFFKDLNVDGLYLADKLHKQNPKLYKKYYSETFLKDINIILEIDTNINKTFN